MSPASKLPVQVPNASRPSAGESVNQTVQSPCAEQRLAGLIRQRIEHRLGDRMRDLLVRIENGRIILNGRCATYYSKQLAQHAALGVLEDEQLENAIRVGVLD